MIRSGALRSITQSLTRFTQSTTRRPFAPTVIRAQLNCSSRSLVGKRPTALIIAPLKPLTAALQRYASTHPGPGTAFDHIDQKREDKIAKTEIPTDPEAVTSDSSVRHVFTEEGVDEPEKETDMLKGVKQDLKTIRDTFALTEVPREALYIGMAGVLPYLATSLSTVFLAWDINHAAMTGSGLLMTGHTAELLLHIIEPIQIGYGAVILSFLGAIHWGLEWAGYGGHVGYRRYAIGVVAPAVAWPTMLLPMEYALIAQFLAFNFLYFADARATVRGWTPPWYATYRFVLTFIVGASIVVSLVGRGEIADKIGKLPGPSDRLKALQDAQMANLEQEERERRAQIVAKDQEEEEEEEDDDDDE